MTTDQNQRQRGFSADGKSLTTTMNTQISRRFRRRCRGFSLLDAVIGLILLAITSLSIATLMPILSRSQHMSDEMSRAVQIATRQIEQLRLVGYNNLEYEPLFSLSLVDSWDGNGPMTFSRIPGDESTLFSVSSTLRDGVGELEILDVADDIRELVVRVKWTTASDNPQSIELTTLIGNL